jgi:hypothetical protein
MVVTIGQTGIRIGETRAAIIPLPPPNEAAQGVTAEYKGGTRGSMMLTTLAEAVRSNWGDAAPESPRATLVVDEGVPFRVLFEVLYTMGQLSVNDLCLAVHQDGRRACIEYAIPKAPVAALAVATLGSLGGGKLGDGGVPNGLLNGIAPSSAKAKTPSAPPLTMAATLGAITVVIGPDGYAIRGAGGNLAPSCDKFGAGATVPKVDGHYDPAGLRKCLESAKTAMGDVTSFTLTANGATPFQTVVDAIDAARETQSGQPLMPGVMFAVPM